MYLFYQNKTLAIPANSLYQDNAIITEANYLKLCQRKIINRLRPGKGLGSYALVEFASVPPRFRELYVQKYGPPPEHRPKSIILQYYTDDFEAADFYRRHEIAPNRNLPPDIINLYIANAQMLNALNMFINTLSVTRNKSNNPPRGGKHAIWAKAVEAVASAKAETGHDLPSSERRLKDMLSAYKQDGYKALISGKFNNKNGLKVTQEDQEAMLRQLMRYHNNLDNAQIMRLYNEIAEKMGWKNITSKTVANYRTKWNLFTIGAQKGEKEFNNMVGMHVKRSAPKHANTFWVLDGWDAELMYQMDGKSHNRLTVVVVLDASCKYPVGYAIGRQENTNLITMALQDAILNTERLFGKKHITLQIQSDNYGKKIMTPIYQKASEKYTPAAVGNAKSKLIESWFNWFNTNFCQFQPNWSGCGIKSKKQPNAEMLNKTSKFFPDEAGAYKQLQGLLEMARAKTQEAYVKSYQEAPEDTKKIINNKDFLMYFGNLTGYKNKLSHSGIVATIAGEKRHYDCFDIEFRKYSHLDWTLKFNPEDLSEVLAYSEETNLSFILNQKHDQPMALYDRQEGDAEELTKVFDYNKALKAPILDSQMADYQITYDLLQAKELDNTLAKLLLTDRNGQHKDVKNKDKSIGEQAQKLIEKQAAKTQKKEEKNAATQREEYLKEKVNISDYI